MKVWYTKGLSNTAHALRLLGARYLDRFLVEPAADRTFSHTE